MAWVAFWLDLGMVLYARHQVNTFNDGKITAHIGNAVWLALAGAVRRFRQRFIISADTSPFQLSLTASIAFAGCGTFGSYSKSPVAKDSESGSILEKNANPKMDL
jgi:hypothetical protein